MGSSIYIYIYTYLKDLLEGKERSSQLAALAVQQFFCNITTTHATIYYYYNNNSVIAQCTVYKKGHCCVCFVVIICCGDRDFAERATSLWRTWSMRGPCLVKVSCFYVGAWEVTRTSVLALFWENPRHVSHYENFSCGLKIALSFVQMK